MKLKKLFISFLILLFFLILITFSQKVFSQEITRETLSPLSLNQLISNIYKNHKETIRKNLFVCQYPEIQGKCATPIIRMALAHPDWLDEENRFILYRPDNPSYIRYYAPDWLVTWTYDTPEGHFKIHYSESGMHAVLSSDGIRATIPDYVISLGSYFEQAWEHMTDPDMLGYDPPPPDGNYGGDSRFDVYIKDMGYYGYTDIENGHPYIVVHNTYDHTEGFESNLDPEGPRIGNMKITAAHEFFHAVQFFYDDWNNDCIWWEENTAVWMEDEVFDEVDGYLNYLGNHFDDLNGNLKWDNGEEPWYYYDGNQAGMDGRENDVWFEAPHISLDTTSTNIFKRYQYGGVIWAKYLAATFGEEFIKDSFIITDHKTDALPAIQQTLLDYDSSIQEAFADFRIKVLTLDFFEEGEQYPLVRHEGNYGDYPINLDLGEDISHLSCRYIGLKAPSGKKKLVIDVDGQDCSHFGVALVLFKEIGYEIRDIPIEYWDEQVGRIEVISFGTEGFYKRATIIPMNLSTYQDYRSLEIYAHLEGIMSYTLHLREGINLVSLPMNLPGAYTSHDFLLNYFDPKVRVQFLWYDPFNRIWQITYLENQPKGALLPINWEKGYLILVPEDMNIDLSGDHPAHTSIDLMPGHNIISSLISGVEALSPKNVLKSTNADPSKQISASILKYDHEKGKHRCGYWFFGRFTGEDFAIREGEGYMIDMVEGHQGWSPTSSE